MKRYDPKYLDEEERQTIETLRKIKVKALPKPTAKEEAAFKRAANEFLRSESKMNIRIAHEELQKIKEQAAKEGLRYQTLVKSVLHKYVTGQLVEKK